MKFRMTVYTLAAIMLFGCSNSAKQASAPSKTPDAAQPVAAQVEKKPVLLDSQDNNYFVWKYDNRIFVIGNPKTSADFETQHHLPYTRTILGAGPNGETVIFEVNKKKPEFAEGLKQRFENNPFLIESKGNNYNVWKYKGRIYVIGNPKTNESFKTLHHLPYTKTVLGAGPFGETVIFEVNKKKPEFAEQLKERYEGTPVLLQADGDSYFVWKLRNRIYVIGNTKTNKSFAKTGHLPYTRTVLGAGPNGETVIFEVDKKNKDLAETLKQRYEQG